MSLLWMEHEPEFLQLVDAAYACCQKEQAAYFSTLPKHVQRIIYRDTRYNIDFLYTAYVLNDDKIMKDYACWLLRLMKAVLKNNLPEKTEDYVFRHFEHIRQAIRAVIPAEKQEALFALIDCAQASIREESAAPDTGAMPPSPYEAEIAQYMISLLQKDTRRALYLIQQFLEKGIPLNDIYVEILAESMHRVGDLWHTAQISVAEEHYCTSVTQMAMSQMYPQLFSSERKHRRIVCACPGTELHEMGSRMVADLFENDGWDSTYLGAAVPPDAMLHTIQEQSPDLVALSVTMPQHLMTCRDLVSAIREKFPSLKIAVGGKAFQSTHDIWKQWPVDLYTADARQLLREANQLLFAEHLS